MTDQYAVTRYLVNRVLDDIKESDFYFDNTPAHNDLLANIFNFGIRDVDSILVECLTDLTHWPELDKWLDQVIANSKPIPSANPYHLYIWDNGKSEFEGSYATYSDAERVGVFETAESVNRKYEIRDWK